MKNQRQRIFPYLITILLCMILAGAVNATTIHVPADQPNIQAGIDVALPGDTVLVAADTYTGAGNFNLNFGGKEIALIGESGAEATILDASDFEWDEFIVIFENGEGPPALIQGFTLANVPLTYAMEGGAVLCRNGSSPTLRELRFVDNNTWDYYPWVWRVGAALECIESGTAPLIENCLFSNNASLLGGAVHTASGACPTFLEVTFIGNGAANGGAVYHHSYATIEFDHCVFIENQARRWTSDGDVQEQGDGGAVLCCGGNSVALFENCLFAGNVAQSGGGYWVDPFGGTSGRGSVLWCGIGGRAQLEGCTLVQNTADVHVNSIPYGAIYVGDASLQMDQCILAYSLEGGGIYGSEGAGTLIELACCDVFANLDGNFIGTCPDFTGIDGNIMSDPLFCGCGALAGDYSLNASSPCLPENNSCGLLMGLYGEGCDDTYYAISGTIVDLEEQPVAGVKISAGSWLEFCETDDLGHYSLMLIAGWSGTLTPEETGYSFWPTQRSYSDLQADITGEDYIAYPDRTHKVPQEFSSIQDAIDFSADGDTVLIAAGTYSGNENWNLEILDKSITLMGEGDRSETIINGEGTHRGIVVRGAASSATTIQNLCIINAYSSSVTTAAGGAIRVEEASCTLRNLVLRDCTTTTWAGGLYAYYSPGLTVEDVAIWGCNTELNGGGMATNQSILIAERLLVTGNYCGTDGSGVYITGGTATIDASIIAFNEGSVPTQGLFGADEAILNLTCSDVYGHADGNYGGIFVDLTGIGGNISADPRFCDPDQGDYQLSEDSPCLPENNECGLQMGPYGVGCQLSTGVPDEPVRGAFLDQNIPNPFNPSTEISFGLAEAARATLAIYDISGRCVKTLLRDEMIAAGAQHVVWDGRDSAGRELPSGVYFCTLQAEGHEWTRKMTLLK